MRLTEQINLLTLDGELRARLGKAGRETVETQFNCAGLATQLVPIYQAAISATT